ncbi:MAG: YceI family protein [Dokdonella sp.]|uniref:YceI family protein n=1 Tax=Dokdonella sp. TaxID=2291710 RepID=UPI002B5DA383|nr:polyisoprenoid-binding protein [Xanthomonadales bacterium]HQV71348.1 YceI family protein [Dokdonella sp.]MBL0223044.1 polyisoprenoid-binding protein [Xanthomonadales bacterium]HQW76244.1 YceI family protein [Dokdonella sp.]HQX64351.1 YceI family protein [Dokdonella sp.]
MSRQTLATVTLGSLLALAASGVARATGAQTFVLDPVHTQIVFFADHLGFSHAIGRLKVKQGWFTFDADDWSTARADVVIDMTSLDMGDAEWTAKVADRAFLDAGNAPTARFLGNALERKTADSGILHGELWLRGVHHDVDLAVTFNRQGTDPYAFKSKAGFSATATLDRFDFGMSTFRDVVAGPVELRIEVEGIRSKHKEIENDADEKQ